MSDWQQSKGGRIRFHHLTAEEEQNAVMVAEVEVATVDPQEKP